MNAQQVLKQRLSGLSVYIADIQSQMFELSEKLQCARAQRTTTERAIADMEAIATKETQSEE